MKTFKEYNKAITHNWATHIKHPSLGEDWVEVESHSLTEDGIIEEYYVEYKGESITIQADEVIESHGGKHEHEPKEKKKKKWNLLYNNNI